MSRCVAVVTDIWRTDSGQEERFTEPLASSAWPGYPVMMPGLPGSGEIAGDPQAVGIDAWARG